MSAFNTIDKNEVSKIEFLIEQNEALYEAKVINKNKFINNSLKLAGCLEDMLDGNTSAVIKDLSPAMLDFNIEQLNTYNRN